MRPGERLRPGREQDLQRGPGWVADLTAHRIALCCPAWLPLWRLPPACWRAPSHPYLGLASWRKMVLSAMLPMLLPPCIHAGTANGLMDKELDAEEFAALSYADCFGPYVCLTDTTNRPGTSTCRCCGPHLAVLNPDDIRFG